MYGRKSDSYLEIAIFKFRQQERAEDIFANQQISNEHKEERGAGGDIEGQRVAKGNRNTHQ